VEKKRRSVRVAKLAGVTLGRELECRRCGRQSL
jgi:hypothetical protein